MLDHLLSITLIQYKSKSTLAHLSFLRIILEHNLVVPPKGTFGNARIHLAHTRNSILACSLVQNMVSS
jgi:hypothetical protein